MVDFVFVDPSPNMELLAKAVRNMGRSVQNVYSKDFAQLRPKNFWTYIHGGFANIKDRKSLPETDANVCTLKKPFFATLKYRSIRKKLQQIDPLLANYTYQDYILLTSPLWQGAELPITVSNMAFDEILSRYPASTIITSKVPSGSGKFTMTYWRTDYDMQEALGEDYFFFFDGKTRHELYLHGDTLVSISENKMKLDWLKSINPTMSRFAFEKVKSFNFHQNQNPWLLKYSSKIYLLNDYSWQGISAVMPENWTKILKKLLCVDKR